MKVLFVTSSWTQTLGHIVRSAAVAEELIIAGHQVAFLVPKTYQEWIPEQAEFYEAVPEPDNNELHYGFNYDYYTYEDIIYVSGHSQEQHLVKTIERERQVISGFGPDVIFNDEQFTTAISAALEKVPVVSVVTWPLHPKFNQHIEKELPQRNLALRKLRNTWNRILKRYNLPPIGHLCELLFDRSCALIAPTRTMLEPELAQEVSGVYFVGRLVPKSMFCEEPAWLKEWGIREGFAHLPTVYIYLSSLPVGVNKKETYETLYRVFEEMECKAVFGLGKFNGLFDTLPSNSPDGRVRFERFVPGETIMGCAQLAIFPGTHSMAVAAAQHCVPCLVIPDLFERRYNAECLSRVGLGEISDAGQPGQGEIRHLIESLLNRKISEEIQCIKNDFQSINGPFEVVQLLLKCEKSGKR
jgi:UDP:flavonoid glycosyltransferase YjiC (YdhE family)